MGERGEARSKGSWRGERESGGWKRRREGKKEKVVSGKYRKDVKENGEDEEGMEERGKRG